MAHSWSIAGGVVTLTLDGSGSGPVSRSRIFTAADGIEADELHTFYLTVNPDAEVEAFLTVGTDTARSSGTGEQTLVARGIADGSGNLEVSFGVTDIGGAPGTGLTIDLEDYATTGDITGDGFSLIGSGSVSIDPTVHEAGQTQSVKFFGGGSHYYRKTFGAGDGIGPSQHYVATVRCRADGRPWYAGPVFRIGEPIAATPYGQSGSFTSPDGVWQTITSLGISTSSSDLRLDFGGGSFPTWFDGVIEIRPATGGESTIDFRSLPFCLGSGIGGTE